jgi:hypothetical protein
MGNLTISAGSADATIVAHDAMTRRGTVLSANVSAYLVRCIRHSDTERIVRAVFDPLRRL